MIKLILFDLGGVANKYPGHKYMAYLHKVSGVPREEINKRIEDDIDVFERGSISLSEFERRVADKLGIAIKDVNWLHFFRQTVHLKLATIEIIKSLKGNYKIGFLSNVDSWRYNRVLKSIYKNLLYLFEYKFTSFKMGVRKPSPSIYKKVVKAVGLKPAEILFIDDIESNVNGAKSAGLKALRFTGAKKLKLGLKRLGIKFKSV